MPTKSRIRLINRNIRSQLNPQENRLKVKLHTFYKKNIRGRNEPTQSLRTIYDSQIKTIIRQAVEEAYFTGVGQVKQTVGKRRQYFISVTDVENIKDIAENMTEQFWTTTDKLHRRENEFIISMADHELIKKQEFDTEAAYLSIASMMIYFTYNSSIVSKSIQVR